MQEIITLALQGKTEKVQKRLEDFSDTSYMSQSGKLHDNIARIAIMQRNVEMFYNTCHHSRILLEEFAPNVNDIKFMVDIYRKHECCWDVLDVPRYVWANASFESVKYMAGDCQLPYTILSDCCNEAQKYFNYVAPCDACAAEIEKESDAFYCRSCSNRLCFDCNSDSIAYGRCQNC